MVSLIYARDVVDRGALSFEQMYSLLLMAIAVGSVLAGIVVGAIGDRLPKGPMVIAGFIGMGLALAAAGVVTDPIVAIVAFLLLGAFNMVYIIPSITLFQELTPQQLMGRVVSSRQALVFGSLAASMGALRVARRRNRSLGCARHQRRDLRGGRRRRHPHPSDAQRPLIRAICYPSRAVGLILDLAVVALAVAVIGSLALLAWTLAVSAVRSVAGGRAEVAAARRRVAEAEQRLQVAGAQASTALARLTDRTRDR